MNSFERCKGIEVRGMADIVKFVRGRSFDGRFVLTNKGALSEFLQTRVGDVIANRSDGSVVGIECKCEESDLYGNFFLETWSNCDFEHRKPGWMWTLRSDVLLYYFLATHHLYSINFRDLWTWALVEGGIYEFKERIQKKYQQLNQTRGRAVPIAVIREKVGFREYSLAGETAVVINESSKPMPPPQILNRESWRQPKQAPSLFQ